MKDIVKARYENFAARKWQGPNHEGVIEVAIEHPRHGEIKTIEVTLEDTRAADSIRVTYDFDRDGWKIEQASTFEWAADDKETDSDFQEVAFIQAWGREK